MMSIPEGDLIFKGNVEMRVGIRVSVGFVPSGLFSEWRFPFCQNRGLSRMTRMTRIIDFGMGKLFSSNDSAFLCVNV